MHAHNNIYVLASLLALTAAGCEVADDDGTDPAPAHSAHAPAHDGATHAAATASQARDPDARVPLEGTLFGATVSSYATMVEGVVTSVGVHIPLAAIEAAPEDGPFQDELILDMPAEAREQTFLSQLRVNWLAYGHGPRPYDAPHFDFHFYRGTSSDIDAIACGAPPRFPPEILSSAQQPPNTCVWGMGYHAWPKADALSGATFTASLILGYTPEALVFIEPMITRATLLQRRDFELAITPPARSGAAARTRFPTRMRALYQPDGQALRLEFDGFVDLD